MKRSLNKLVAASMVCCFLIACKKDETKVFAKSGVAPTVSASPATIVLKKAEAADSSETISWTKSDYGFNAAVNYTVQLAKAGTNFAKRNEVAVGSKTQLKLTVGDFNQIALAQGLAPNTAGQLEVRVKSSLNDSLAIYSNKITINVTPFALITYLWVPGDYQGWDPASAPKLASVNGNGAHEGYVNFPAGGTFQFKLTNAADWNHTAYGWASSTVTGTDVSGTFNTTGGNLFVPGAGYYLVKANTNDNSWSGTKITSISLIGDFNNWAADADMAYNSTTKKWSATANFPSAGAFKFRINHAWTLNFGDTGADLSLEYDGSNISITPGSHTITLDLSDPTHYTYTIQ
jgi:hypothetical protein